MSATLDALMRLKRRMGRERGRFIRIYNAASSPLGKERASHEITMIGLCMGFVDDEIARARLHPGSEGEGPG